MAMQSAVIGYEAGAHSPRQFSNGKLKSKRRKGLRDVGRLLWIRPDYSLPTRLH